MAMRQAILIADDIEMNRAILRTFFEDTYDILEAANGVAALHQIHEGRDSLAAVLLDIVMPEMDFRFWRHFRATSFCSGCPS